ncbi:SH3 domain-containing protein [Sulfitobacter sp. D35]|uniref:SH3 domain-containing protein n=1 Tax=Sulfitobacter sp. D35 TaxID=3083252 RepID=UPI00296E40E8|nr:SH3 domain-containing protein [Sulfitobacter sp. D35]MDW4500364.1 SH3 domain-containing protein [Sulfitobacter sp. D35]
MKRQLASLALVALMAAPASAQQILVPSNRAAMETGCLVQGLDPNGDGFLALRAGPGSDHAQIGSLRNGDAAYLAAPPAGRWLYVENGAIGGREAKFRGWIYDAWCQFYP